MENQKLTYQIKVRGTLDPTWSEWFAGLKIEMTRDNQSEVVTTLTGSVTDQSALRGILCKLWDLNLTLISVIQTKKRDCV